MKRIDLEIKALSPLAIGRQKPGVNISEANEYIPGSVIRGAIASQIIKQANSPITIGDNFHELFLGENPAIFQNAYPGSIEGEKSIRVQPDVGVIPSTALSSKAKPGFKSQPQDPKHNGVFDTLIDRFCAESYGYIYDPNCPSETVVDGDRVDNFTGFYSKLNNKYYSHKANTRLLTRVGINRRRATSEERVLYSIEVLNESKEYKQKPIKYTGMIFVGDDLAESLQKFIENNKDNLRLGGSASRGLGKVEIQAKTPVNIKERVSQQVDKFNKKIYLRWDEWKKIFGSPLENWLENRIYFTIDLQADAILNENWRPTTVISPEMLQQFTEISDLSLQLHAAYSSYDYRSGWNSAWGLMKDVELVTNKGSVYLFSTVEKDLWLKALENLEVTGVGERTCEGFGQIRVCDDFHLILRENAV